MEITEYAKTLSDRPRRVPIRSISRPRTVWPIEYAKRKAITRYA
jgi:hypothetical protein